MDNTSRGVWHDQVVSSQQGSTPLVYQQTYIQLHCESLQQARGQSARRHPWARHPLTDQPKFMLWFSRVSVGRSKILHGSRWPLEATQPWAIAVDGGVSAWRNITAQVEIQESRPWGSGQQSDSAQWFSTREVWLYVDQIQFKWMVTYVTIFTLI